MITIRFLLTYLLLVFVFLNISLYAEGSSGWRHLFDGTTTEAWVGFTGNGFPTHRWVIEDGCLKALKFERRVPGAPRGGRVDLVTVDEFDDFELEWQWRIGTRGNSGVKYFVRRIGGGPIGHEYQLLDDHNRPRNPLHSTAALYDLLQPTETAPKPTGEFNHSRLVIQGNAIEHWLNGKKVLEYELGGEKLSKAVAQSKFKDIAGFGTKLRTRILLQDYGDEVWFRNIRIREFRTTE